MSSVATGADLSPRESVTALVRGVPVQVACTAWCATDHTANNLVGIEDVTHETKDIAVSTPDGLGGTEDVMIARLSQYPFLRHGETGPVLVLDSTGSGECAELTKTEARAHLDQYRAHLDAIEALVDLLP